MKQQKHQSPLTSYRNKKLLAKSIKLLRSLQWAPFPAGGHTGNTQCRTTTTTANHPHPRSPTYRNETPQINFDPHSDTDRSPAGVKREPKKKRGGWYHKKQTVAQTIGKPERIAPHDTNFPEWDIEFMNEPMEDASDILTKTAKQLSKYTNIEVRV